MVEEFYTAFQEQDIKTIKELLAPNYVVKDKGAAYDTSYSKYDAFSKKITVRMKALGEALPNYKLSLLEMIGEKNKVVARLQITGVQKGPFLGIEPMNKPLIINMFAIFTIDNGKITEITEIWNEFSLMQQIGYIVL